MHRIGPATFGHLICGTAINYDALPFFEFGFELFGLKIYSFMYSEHFILGCLVVALAKVVRNFVLLRNLDCKFRAERYERVKIKGSKKPEEVDTPRASLFPQPYGRLVCLE